VKNSRFILKCKMRPNPKNLVLFFSRRATVQMPRSRLRPSFHPTFQPSATSSESRIAARTPQEQAVSLSHLREGICHGIVTSHSQQQGECLQMESSIGKHRKLYSSIFTSVSFYAGRKYSYIRVGKFKTDMFHSVLKKPKRPTDLRHLSSDIKKRLTSFGDAREVYQVGETGPTIPPSSSPNLVSHILYLLNIIMSQKYNLRHRN
jgi:hypothetical protein